LQLPCTNSWWNSAINGGVDGLKSHRKNVVRVFHVDFLDEVFVLHDLAELTDHDVGQAVDLAEEVRHLEFLERAQQIFDPEAAWICVVEGQVVVARNTVKPKETSFYHKYDK
jgi:hypothetical protein